MRRKLFDGLTALWRASLAARRALPDVPGGSAGSTTARTRRRAQNAQSASTIALDPRLQIAPEPPQRTRPSHLQMPDRW